LGDPRLTPRPGGLLWLKPSYSRGYRRILVPRGCRRTGEFEYVGCLGVQVVRIELCLVGCPCEASVNKQLGYNYAKASISAKVSHSCTCSFYPDPRSSTNCCSGSVVPPSIHPNHVTRKATRPRLVRLDAAGQAGKVRCESWWELSSGRGERVGAKWCTHKGGTWAIIYTFE